MPPEPEFKNKQEDWLAYQRDMEAAKKPYYARLDALESEFARAAAETEHLEQITALHAAHSKRKTELYEEFKDVFEFIRHFYGLDWRP